MEKYETTQAAYRQRKNSFNKFLGTDAGKRFQEKNEKIIADDLGMTVEEMKAEIKKRDEKHAAEIMEEMANEWMCDSCFETFNYNGETKCPDCGSKKIGKLI